MGAFLDKPNTDKKSEKGDGNGMRYGLASMQGWRVEMEDAHCAVTGLQGNLKDWSFFAVFDGHAGATASEYCAKQLLQAIVDTEELKRAMHGMDADTVPTVEEVQQGIKEGFLRLDETMRQRPEVKCGEDKSGSTAVCVLVSPHHYFFANCGDSRAILISDGKVKYHTNDHKPGNPLERERIQNAGGSVMIQRVNGSLAVSRALGDYEYKNVKGKGPCEQLVSPEPEISVIERVPGADQLVVLACDGVWDVMSNQELAEYLLDRVRVSHALEDVARQCLDTCLHKGSRDNMSIVVVGLESAPGVTQEALDRESRLDAALEKRVLELMQQFVEAAAAQAALDKSPGGGHLPGQMLAGPGGAAELDVNRIFNRLSPDDFDGLLPPAGGLAAKRTKVDEIFNRHKEDFEAKLVGLRDEKRKLEEQGRNGSLGGVGGVAKQLKKTGRVASDDVAGQACQSGDSSDAAGDQARPNPNPNPMEH